MPPYNIKQALIGMGLAIVAILYLKKKAGDLLDDAQKAAKEAMDAAVKATNDTVFGEGQGPNSVIPLYNRELPTRPADYNPGSIDEGAIF